MNFDVLKVLPKDALEYIACHIACWQSAYRCIIPDDFLDNMPDDIEKRTERLIKSLNESTEDYFYYAALDGKMIGRLIFGKSRDEDKPGAGEIQAVYLLAEFWGKGYGKIMMDYAVAELKLLGYDELLLWVLKENHRARRFYEKYGFTHDGKSKEVEFGKTLTVVRYTLKKAAKNEDH